MPSADIASVTATLAIKRAELEQDIETIVAPLPDSGGISFGKRIGDGTSIAVERLTQVAAHDGLGHALAEVIRAQAKLDEGTYGYCDRCGEPIAKDRLLARPWATHCVTCAAGL